RQTEVFSPAERVAYADFRLSEVLTPQSTPPSELSIVQQAFNRRKVVKYSRYADVSFVPSTSNECETLEMLMFLMYNKDMRDVNTFEAVRK
ncbi:hypothetical protein PHMEG_00034354, partial [Phytophthora megakarya]